MEMLAQGFQLTLGHAKGHVTGAAGAVERNCPSIHNDPLALCVLRIEQQQNAFLTTEGQHAIWNRGYLCQAEHVLVKTFSRVQIIHIERSFQYAAEPGRYGAFAC